MANLLGLIEPAQLGSPQQLALLAELVIREFGEWEEERIKQWCGEKIYTVWHLDCLGQFKANCRLYVYWSDHNFQEPDGTWWAADEQAEVLVWADGHVERYDDKLGEAAIELLLNRFANSSCCGLDSRASTPLFHLLQRVGIGNDDLRRQKRDSK